MHGTVFNPSLARTFGGIRGLEWETGIALRGPGDAGDCAASPPDRFASQKTCTNTRLKGEIPEASEQPLYHPRPS